MPGSVVAEKLPAQTSTTALYPPLLGPSALCSSAVCVTVPEPGVSFPATSPCNTHPTLQTGHLAQTCRVSASVFSP